MWCTLVWIFCCEVWKKTITISQIYKKLPSCLTTEKHSKPIKTFSITRCLREAFIEKNLLVKVKKSISWNNCSTTKDQITTNFAVPDWLLEEQILIIQLSTICQRSNATPRRQGGVCRDRTNVSRRGTGGGDYHSLFNLITSATWYCQLLWCTACEVTSVESNTANRENT